MPKDVITITDSDSSEDDLIDASNKNTDFLRYLHDYKSVPVFSSTTHFSYSEAVEIILSRNKERVCCRHPVLVEENASFLNQLSHVDDSKADDCGHWIHNRRKTTKVAVWTSKGAITKVVSINKNSKSPPDENSKLFMLVRVYYVHNPHSDFKRTYYYLYG